MHTVYKITNNFNNEYYIGVHETLNPNDSYYGSGLRIKRSISKYGKCNFSKEILFVFEATKEAYNKEIELISKCINDPNCLNLGEGGKGGSNFKGKKHSEKTKTLLRDQSTGRKLSKKAKQNISEANRNRVINNSTKEKIKNKAIDRYSNGEGQKKISNGMKKFYANKEKECWIYNLDLKKSKKVAKSSLSQWIDNGWIKGRKIKF